MKTKKSENEIRREMAELGGSLFNRGYAVGGAGNMSARLPDGSLLVTPTNSSMGRLDPARLSKVGMDGVHLGGDRPSKEYAFHKEMYRDSGCGAVVHLHSTYLTALSCLRGLDPENVIAPFTPYFVMRVGRLALLPYFAPGSPKIAEALAERVGMGGAFLLANHGVIVTGADITEAVNNAEELEETAKLYFILSGKDVRYLTPEEIAALNPLAAAPR